MIQVQQTHEEKFMMYMKCTKKELAEMLINCNEVLSELTPQPVLTDDFDKLPQQLQSDLVSLWLKLDDEYAAWCKKAITDAHDNDLHQWNIFIKTHKLINHT